GHRAHPCPRERSAVRLLPEQLIHALGRVRVTAGEAPRNARQARCGTLGGRDIDRERLAYHGREAFPLAPRQLASAAEEKLVEKNCRTLHDIHITMIVCHAQGFTRAATVWCSPPCRSRPGSSPLPVPARGCPPRSWRDRPRRPIPRDRVSRNRTRPCRCPTPRAHECVRRRSGSSRQAARTSPFPATRRTRRFRFPIARQA